MKISPDNPRAITADPEIMWYVRTTRQMLGLNQTKFAKLFPGYTLAIVKNWEAGRTLPRADVFLRLLKLRKACLRRSHSKAKTSNHDEYNLHQWTTIANKKF